MSSKQIVFLDTEVFKGPRFIQGKILNNVQTHFNPTETFQYTHFFSCHPLSVKKGFVKVETLRLLRTNPVKESFELKKKEFLTRLIERGYPRELVETVLVEVRFESRKTALQNKPKTSKKILPFMTTSNLATPNLKKVLMKHWRLITGNNTLGQIYPLYGKFLTAVYLEVNLSNDLERNETLRFWPKNSISLLRFWET